MWALGVTMFQIVTGELPFNTSDESIFRDQVLHAKVDYSRLAAHNPRIKVIIENLIKVDMYKRWDANMLLVYC
jgi:serine/threonine protein kinase